ncbi:MAG: thiamine pyrophosphate-dependent enzyme, partial [Siphonobacter sp.]
DRVLIAVGQQRYDPEVVNLLWKLQEEYQIPVMGDVLANLPEGFIRNQDFFLVGANETLQPDLLITCGESFISKNLKMFFRKYSPQIHIHLSFSDYLIDPFQTLTQQIAVGEGYFFKTLLEELDRLAFQTGDEERDEAFLSNWQQADRKAKAVMEQAWDTEFGEFTAVRQVFEKLPSPSQLHLANSMSVRYGNYIGVKNGVEVFSNRGTSGIDGCMSTAVGAAQITRQLVFLLIGDVAFFYDRNALWHPHVPDNLRIIVLNNAGGSIFRMIEGPRQQPELEQYFETQHNLSAKQTAEEFNLNYWQVETQQELEQALPAFMKDDQKAKLLEISTSAVLNQHFFDEFKRKAKEL